MAEEWAECIDSSIKRFRSEVLSLINEGFYEIAGMELGNCIFIFNEGFEKMPMGTVQTYAFGLLARFQLLQKYCLEAEEMSEEEEKRKHIKGPMEKIEERIHLVELGISSFLPKKMSTTCPESES